MYVKTDVIRNRLLTCPLKKYNQSPKGNMWSAIPVALLSMILNWSERKQGSGPEGDKVLQNTEFSFVPPSVQFAV